MCVTDRHDMTLAVKVALNPNTTNQTNILNTPFQVKQMYNKVSGQTDSLKSLWAAKMNLKGTNVLLTEDDIAAYNRTLLELERELERRKEVGHRFSAILARQEQLATEDEKYREEHQVLTLSLLYLYLTLSQTTNFRLFQIRRVCRRQFQIG